MTDVIAMDNFSSIAAQGQRIELSPWTRKRYAVFGKNLLATAGVVNSRNSLTVVAPEETVFSHGLATRLPNELTRFCTGFLVRNFVPTLRALSAQFGVGSMGEDGVFKALLLLKLKDATTLEISYKDSTETTRTEVFTYSAPSGIFNIDYSFDKVSNTPGEMSNVTLFVDNLAVASGDFFNNAGTDLAIMHLGVVPTVSVPNGPYLIEIGPDASPKEYPSGSFSLTDLWVTRNGRRFGRATVSRTPSTGTVGMLANVGDPLFLINQSQPNIDRNLYGKRISAAFTDHTEAVASQLTALVQRNSDSTAAATLEFGEMNNVEITPELKLVRVTSAGAPDRAELRIES